MPDALKYAVVAVVAAVSAMASAGAVVAFIPHQPVFRAASAETQLIASPAHAAPASSNAIAKSADGHFWVSAGSTAARYASLSILERPPWRSRQPTPRD